MNGTISVRYIVTARWHQWKSTQASWIEGYGGSWGASREIVKYIYFLTQMLELTGFSRTCFFFPLWIYEIKFTCQNGTTIIILHCTAACIADWFFCLEVLTSSFPSPASVCFSGLWSSQGLCFSGPGCSLVLELCLFLSGSLFCLLDLLPPVSGSQVLVLQFWSPCSSGPGLMLYCLHGRWLHCIM